MITVDGSFGEGGGSILRNALALSALTLKPIHIKNVRVKRQKTGLMPQHLSAVKTVSKLSDAECNKLGIGSTEFSFKPQTLKGGDFKIDIKTAGSVTLVLQAVMIPAGFADSPVEITIKGGTDVKWSPTADYMENVTLKILKKMGYRAEINILRRGHYPKGGGVLKAEIKPIKKLEPVKLIDLQFEKVNGVSHVTNLPEHVAVRQADTAGKILAKKGIESEIKIEHSDDASGPGSGITLWSDGEIPVGGSCIGKRGLKAEKVGQFAAEEISYHVLRGAALDKYMGDQIIPYMVIAGKSMVKIAELTQHTLTNIYVSQLMLQKELKVDGKLGGVSTVQI